MSDYTPEAERLQRKFRNLTAQVDLVQSAFSDLRREISNVASAAWDAVEATALAEQGETEWEYGSEGAEGTEDPDPRPLADDNAYWHESLEGVREPNAEQAAQIVAKWNEGDPGSARLIRRRKAGPWLPVPGSTVRESDSGVRDSDSEESESEK